MAQMTANYNLKKPLYTENADVADLNENFDALDAALTPSVSQTSAPTSSSVSGKLAVVLGWLANRIKAVTGRANWYEAPGVTLADCQNHINDGVHTAATASKAGIMSAADKSKLDAATAASTANALMLRDASGRAQTASPSAANDIVNKTYADSTYVRMAAASTMTAQLTAQSNANYTTRQVRNVVFWTSGASPPTTQNGDIVIKTF
jgi:hypothetical protein